MDDRPKTRLERVLFALCALFLAAIFAGLGAVMMGFFG